MPSGAAAAAAGLRGEAAGAASGSVAVAVALRADAGAPGPAAPLLRVLAHGAPGVVPVQVAPRRLRVGAPAAVRAGGHRRHCACRSRASDAREDGGCVTVRRAAGLQAVYVVVDLSWLLMAPSCVVLYCDDVTVKCTNCIVVRTQKKDKPTCACDSVQLLDFSRK